MQILPDKIFEELKASLNGAIHEIVFACHHLEDDQLEDAATCLVTAQGTIESVTYQIAAIEQGIKKLTQCPTHNQPSTTGHEQPVNKLILPVGARGRPSNEAGAVKPPPDQSSRQRASAAHLT